MNDHNNVDSSALDLETCRICQKPISPTRPPTFNPDNCSCAEIARFTDGQGLEYTSFPTASSPYDQTHIPESNASSNLNDGICPNGIQKDTLNLQLQDVNGNGNGNRFLELAPPRGNNETQARRSFSFHRDYPFQLQRYLNTQDSPYCHTQSSAISESPELEFGLPAGRYIEQGMCFQALSMEAQNQSSRRSKKSIAERSGTSGETSWYGFRNMDPLAGAGGWIDRDGDLYERHEAPEAVDDEWLNEY